ncbi:hypothetical protein [Candidatus Nanohalovita haloferacivicina]|uniref:hypothetical protein n=1 Tax=Candidatus Nanohalovita haloferacivicina TaxID=2978046 RepID=UPI00325F9F92|nr:hypothetical protein HBNXNv_0100 [Candidatus Nanohalobia archaeon BNXNv]
MAQNPQHGKKEEVEEIQEKQEKTLKGLTPVVSTVILIAISTSAVGGAYFIASSQIQAQEDNSNLNTELIGQLSVENCAKDNENTVLTLRNNNDEAVNLSKLNVYVEGEKTSYSTGQDIVNPKQTSTINISENVSRETESIRLATPETQLTYICQKKSGDSAGITNPGTPGSGTPFAEKGGPIQEIIIMSSTGNNSILPYSSNTICIGNCGSETATCTDRDPDCKVDNGGDSINGSVLTSAIRYSSGASDICIGKNCDNVTTSSTDHLSNSSAFMRGPLELNRIKSNNVCIGSC